MNPERHRVALKVYYDGTKFEGFQRQPHGRTVEDRLIEALVKERIIEGAKEARWKHASRTDRGVSAIWQVVAFDVDEEGLTALRRSLMRINRRLLPDICAWAWAEAPPGFDPRRDARLRRYAYVAPDEGEDVQSMIEAAKVLSGTHDFSRIAKPDRGSGVRTVRIAVGRLDGCWCIIFEGPGFYRHLLRKLASIIIMAGRGELDTEDIRRLLEHGGAVEPAPAEGLVLLDVIYDENKISFVHDPASVMVLTQLLRRIFTAHRVRAGVYELILQRLRPLEAR